MIDSELVPWGKGEKEFVKKNLKVLKFNVDNQLELLLKSNNVPFA